jgi:hypothetical protein
MSHYTYGLGQLPGAMVAQLKPVLTATEAGMVLQRFMPKTVTAAMASATTTAGVAPQIGFPKTTTAPPPSGSQFKTICEASPVNGQYRQVGGRDECVLADGAVVGPSGNCLNSAGICGAPGVPQAAAAKLPTGALVAGGAALLALTLLR